MSKRSGLGKRALGFISCMVAVPLCAYILPAVNVEPVYMSFLVGLIMGVFYITLRPIARLLTLRWGILGLIFSSILVDAGALLLLAHYLPGFSFESPQWALVVALIMMVLRCPVLR